MIASRPARVVLALVAAWCLAMSLRDIWTPDEPRELALAASQAEHFSALPTLGGRPFSEKPPLAYWISGATMSVLGVSGSAARVPLVVYALIALASVFLLGRRMGGAGAGVVSALVFSTGGLVFNTQIWLATDALLVASVSLALLGVYLVFDGPGKGKDFWVGCACMHVGLALALFTKNLAGWLVPVTALLVFALVQRKLRRLWHPGVWLPVLGSLALLWIWAQYVAAAPGGMDRVHALFWDNLAGRLGSYVNTSQSVRALGHRNWPGKYLVELPLYLLPWTPLVAGAAIRLWRDRRTAWAVSGQMRFALCAFLPALVLLSFAATSRGIYAAPIMPGIALFVALALTTPTSNGVADPLVRASIHWTTWLVLVLDGTLLTVIAALHASRGIRDVIGLFAAAAGLAVVCIACLGMRNRMRDAETMTISAEDPFVTLAGAHIAALGAICLSSFPLLDRALDLKHIASHIERASQGRPLVLWLPDETTLAMSDLYMRRPACSILLDVETEVQRTRHLSKCLEDHPDAAVVGMRNCASSECNRSMRVIARDDPFQKVRLDFQDAVLANAHVQSVDGIVRPGGRVYLVGFRAP